MLSLYVGFGPAHVRNLTIEEGFNPLGLEFLDCGRRVKNSIPIGKYVEPDGDRNMRQTPIYGG